MDYKFPGVYPTITDLSQVVTANSALSCAYVGMAEFGPINEPTLITNLKMFNQKFGKLNPKYGYEGYALSVAADTINQHYYVRVVGDDAKYACASFAFKGSTATDLTAGYSVEEIERAKEDSSALFAKTTFNEDGSIKETVKDTTTAFIITSSDPNNRKIQVVIEDSTINEFKIHKGLAIKQGTETGKYYVVLSDLSAAIDEATKRAELLSRFAVGDKVEISGAKNEAFNGIATVDAFDGTNLTFTLPDGATVTDIEADKSNVDIRVQKQPEEDETSFRVRVFETVGKVTQNVETFDFVTLYDHQDNYGNSTFIEDVINGNSEYILAFVNPNAESIVPSETEYVELKNGTSGSEPDTKAYVDGWALFNDRTRYYVNLLINAGNVSADNYSVQSAMLAVAEKRRDCFCLFDVPRTDTKSDAALDWRTSAQGFNSYRGALFSPWVKTYNADQGKKNFLMPPSAYMAKIMGACGDPWIAPAGPNRGSLSSSIVTPTGLTEYYDETVGGTLYEKQINCIIKENVGYTNWGQKTLQQKPSALDRINVARTVMFIETTLRDAARAHLFENNTAYERMQITLQFGQFLDTVLNAGGLSKYSVVCDSSNNTAQVLQNNQMVIDIYLWPVYCAEIIKLNTIVMGADAQVTVTSSN